MSRGLIAVQNGFVLDLTEIKPILHRRFSSALDAGIKAWVQTADSIIPTWSGGSRATLIELGAKVGVQVSVYAKDGVKSRVDLGKRETPPPVIRKSRLYGEYYFQWKTSLDYFVNNETKPMNAVMKNRLIKETPYNFREAAGQAFREALMREVGKESPASIVRKSLRIVQLRSK